MDIHTVGRRQDNVLVSVDDESSDPSSSSEENSGGGTSRPTVRSKNPGRAMMDDVIKRSEDQILLKESIINANNLSPGSLNASKAYLLIQKEIRKVLDKKASMFDEYKEDTKALREAYEIVEDLINTDIEYYKERPAKEIWTATSGALSYLLTFCTGTLLANAVDLPLLSPLVIGICWTLCERFPPMVRATSWSNTHADVTYPELMQMTKRATQDWVRQLAGLKPMHFMKNGEKITAADKWKEGKLFEAWLGKVASDDLMSHTFTIFYIARNVLLRTLTSPAFLATPPGKAISLGTLASAGLCAGATAALGFQGVRGCQYKAAHPEDATRGETLVKSIKTWNAEFKAKEKAVVLTDKLAKNKGSKIKGIEGLNEGIPLQRADLGRTAAKASCWTSVPYEFSILFRGEIPLGAEDNGEVAAKLQQTISGFFAKMICLLPSALFATYALPILASPSASLAQQLGMVIIAPVILIVFFGLRKEIEFLVLAIIGLLLGFYDVLCHQITGKDKLQDAAASMRAKALAELKIVDGNSGHEPSQTNSEESPTSLPPNLGKKS